MPISLTVVSTPEKSKKRLKAIFRIHKGGKIIKITNFGLKGGSTYIDNKDKIKRKNYRKRHKGDLKTNDFKRGGFLSMGLLWGEHTDLKNNLIDYKRRFNLD
tara:strand:+ start:2106 stop:2411 length:306 start_codon:yes stop_codon:yes gene_type:complete